MYSQEQGLASGLIHPEELPYQEQKQNLLDEILWWFEHHPQRELIEKEILEAKRITVVDQGSGMPHELPLPYQIIDTQPHPKCREILKTALERVGNGKLPKIETVGKQTLFRDHACFEGDDAPFRQGVICGHEENADGSIIYHDPEHPCGDTVLISKNEKSFQVLLADSMGHGEEAEPFAELLQVFFRKHLASHPEASLEKLLGAFDEYFASVPILKDSDVIYAYSLFHFQKNLETRGFSLSSWQSGNFSLIITKDPDGSFSFVESQAIVDVCDCRPIGFLPKFQEPYRQELTEDFALLAGSDGPEDIQMPDGRRFSKAFPGILQKTVEENPTVSAEELGRILFEKIQEIHMHTDSSPTDDVTLICITGSDLNKQLS